jgi:predicted DNA-binding transcriptional regulator YafY
MAVSLAEALRETVADLPARLTRSLVRDATAQENDPTTDLPKPRALRLAMATATKVGITYTRKRDGRTLDYVVRPYEAKPHPQSGNEVLYAQDHKHGGQIHAFLMSRIERTTNLTRATFSPTWPTRPESV